MNPNQALRYSLRLILLFLLVVAISSCAFTAPIATTPMATLHYPKPGKKPAPILIVFLPGKGARAADFENQGFIQAVREFDANVDLVAADAHFSYLINRTMNERLRADVMEPARRHGYQEIWMVGTSMGGLNALLYDIEHPGEVTGILLLGPFLGDPPIILEIEAAGGLAEWIPGQPTRLTRENYQKVLWGSLKKNTEPGQAGVKLHLGYGERDRFASAHRLLAERLPQRQVLVSDGGHSWRTWLPLWQQFLQESEWFGKLE